MRHGYITLQAEGKNHRLKLKDIADFRPLLDAISLAPMGCTIVCRDGREIDINMSVEQLKSKINWG